MIYPSFLAEASSLHLVENYCEQARKANFPLTRHIYLLPQKEKNAARRSLSLFCVMGFPLQRYDYMFHFRANSDTCRVIWTYGPVQTKAIKCAPMAGFSGFGRRSLLLINIFRYSNNMLFSRDINTTPRRPSNL